VLRRRPLGEADSVVTLLSPSLGRFDAVARGARASKTSRGGMVEPLNHLKLLLAEGRSLDVVSQVQTVKAWRGVGADLHRVAVATYLLELYGALVEPGPHASSARVFGSLVRALDELEEAVLPVTLGCARAELRLLTVMGIAPGLDACVVCGAVADVSRFSARDGGIACRACAPNGALPVSVETLALVRALRDPEVARLNERAALFPAGSEHAAQAVVRAHLDWHLPQPPRSRAFLQQVAE